MRKALLCSAVCVIGLAFGGVARAEMVLSQVVVDLLPGKPARQDIEVLNNSAERMYVLAEPFEIVDAGTPDERRIAVKPDTETDLLVSPLRLVLEPNERRIIRVAALGARPASDRIYRVAIKPVAGALVGDASALKVLVGYDTLVLVRPDHPSEDLRVERRDEMITIRNSGNTSEEIFDGKQCDTEGRYCRTLPSKRLYPGAQWVQKLPFKTSVQYKVAIGSDVRVRSF